MEPADQKAGTSLNNLFLFFFKKVLIVIDNLELCVQKVYVFS